MGKSEQREGEGGGGEGPESLLSEVTLVGQGTRGGRFPQRKYRGTGAWKLVGGGRGLGTRKSPAPPERGRRAEEGCRCTGALQAIGGNLALCLSDTGCVCGFPQTRDAIGVGRSRVTGCRLCRRSGHQEQRR